MRKSEGKKRRFISDSQVDDILREYEAFQESAVTKIFNMTDFGYRKITVEQPLKLAFYPGDELRQQNLYSDSAWDKLDSSLQDALQQLFISAGDAQFNSRDQFGTFVKKGITAKLSAAEFKLLCKHLGEQDEDAEICRDSKGQAEAASDLRDYESVPLNEDIDGYFAREVLPHVPGAWIDRSKVDDKDGEVGIVGYEINFSISRIRSIKTVALSGWVRFLKSG